MTELLYRLAIKESVVINHCRRTSMRLAAPVLHTWKWRDIAISTDKEALEEYARGLHEEYRIYNAGDGTL